VFTPVGWTVLTLMLGPASSLAIDLARPTTPCFAASYGAKNGRPLIPAVELTQMIDPPPLPIRCGTAVVDDLPDGGGVPDVGLPGDDLPAERRHGRDRVREILLGAPFRS
jgi:hypothetical protein